MLISTMLPEACYGSIVEVFSGHILDAENLIAPSRKSVLGPLAVFFTGVFT